MGKIICLMGKSSTGKDTIFNALLQDMRPELNRIVSYTTRPIRNGEEEGWGYHFVTEADFQRLEEEGRIIEQRIYHTCHGPWRYFTADDERLELEKGNYAMIGTLESYRQMQAYFGREVMIPVLIELDDGERLQRALDRERSQENPKYEEMCRRFLADGEDFSEDRIKEAGITKSFENRELKNTIEQIKSYLCEQL